MPGIKEIFISKLDKCRTDTRKGVWAMYYEGLRITLTSKKSFWNSRGAASNALRNELSAYSYSTEREECFQELLTSGTITIEEIAPYGGEALLSKTYNWESLTDIEQDIFWALDSMPGEFDGTIKIKVIRCNQK